VLNSELVTTLEAFKLRDDKYTFLFESPNTNKDFLFSNPKALKTDKKFLVLGVSKVKSSTTIKLDSFAFNEKADQFANITYDQSDSLKPASSKLSILCIR
jgi:hypothetical protein